MMMGSVFRAVRTWPAVLFSVLFLTLALQRVAANQETAPAPLIEFTVQTGHTAEIQGLEYAADGKFFVSAGKDSAIKLWSPEGTLIRTIHTGFWVNYLALSHDGKLLLAASRTGNVFLLSLDGRVVHRFPDIPLREKFVSAVALSDDNRNVAVGTTKGVALYGFENGVESRVQAEGDTSEVESVLYTHDGRLIFKNRTLKTEGYRTRQAQWCLGI